MNTPKLTIKDIHEAQVPYPARRKYKWAEPDVTMSYEHACKMFAKARLQAYSAGATHRYKAFDLVIQSLTTLSEDRGINEFPGPKLHKLLCKAALAAGWCTDLNAIQRKRVAKLAPDQADVYICPSCGEAKHKDEYMVPASPAQCAMWGWGSKKKDKKVRARVCRTCHEKKNRVRIAKVKRLDANRIAKEYENLVAKQGYRAALHLAYDYWSEKIKRSIHSNKIALTASTHQPTLDYYQLRLELLSIALENLTIAVQDETFIETWTHLLSPRDQKQLYDTYAQLLTLRRNEFIRGTPPAL